MSGGEPMRSDVRAWSEARLDELRKRGRRDVHELRAGLEEMIVAERRTIRVTVRDGRLALAALVDRDGAFALEQFELDPDLVSAGSRGPGSIARQEIGARRGAERALIEGVADALELAHGIRQARETVGGGGGGELLHDLIGLGAQTLRELLHLNARANRRLLSALRTLAPPGGSGEPVMVSPEGRAGAALELDPGGASSRLMLESRRRGVLAVALPREVSVCHPDGLGVRTLALRCEPERVELVTGDRRAVNVCLKEPVMPDAQRGVLLGEMILGTGDGEVARVAVRIGATPT